MFVPFSLIIVLEESGELDSITGKDAILSPY